MFRRFCVVLAFVMLVGVLPGAAPAHAHPKTAHYTSTWNNDYTHCNLILIFCQNLTRDVKYWHLGSWSSSVVSGMTFADSQWDVVPTNESFTFAHQGQSGSLPATKNACSLPDYQSVVFFTSIDGQWGTWSTTHWCGVGTEIKKFSIWIDSAENWYFGTTGTPAGDQADFPGTIVHEFGHANGFNGHFGWNTDACGPNGFHDANNTMCPLYGGGEDFERTLEVHDKHTFQNAYA